MQNIMVNGRWGKEGKIATWKKGKETFRGEKEKFHQKRGYSS